MSDKEELIKEYERNILNAKEELKYYFQEIKRLKSLINKNQIMINAITSYQLPISFFN